MTNRVKKGSTDVSRYFKVPAGSTITNLDLVYTRYQTAPSTKVDATAGSVSSHSDNTAVYVDSTNAPELLKVDFPDAAFASGVDEVILSVHDPVAVWSRELRVLLVDNIEKDTFDRIGAPVGASISSDLQVIDANVDDIETDTNEIQTKLPTNNIMGSSVKTDKDDEIDAIKLKTDNLPADPASETNVDANETKIDAIKVDTAAILIDSNEIQSKLPTNNIMGSSDTDDHDTDIDAIKAKTDLLAFTSGSVNANVDKLAGLTTVEGFTIEEFYKGSAVVLLGPVSRSGNVYQFKDKSNTNTRVTHTIGTGGRTVAFNF